MGINGSPSLSQVQAEFGGSNPIRLNEYYSVRFSDGSFAPSGGTIALSHFRNKSKWVPISPGPTPVPTSSGCFYEETPIKLSDNRLVAIKDVKLGDTLIDGNVVNATLRIRNSKKRPFYKIFSKELNDNVYVTSDHHIYEDNKFIHVENSKHSTISDKVEDMFVCLITSRHNIPIGEYTFWDWADWCDSCQQVSIPQEFFNRTDRENVL